MSLLAGLLVAGVVAVGLWYLFPEGTERWLARLMAAKKIVFGASMIILALFLLATGAFELMLLGVIIFVLVFLYILSDPEGAFSDYNLLE